LHFLPLVVVMAAGVVVVGVGAGGASTVVSKVTELLFGVLSIGLLTAAVFESCPATEVWTTRVKSEMLPFETLAFVALIPPLPPTGGVVVVQPEGAEND